MSNEEFVLKLSELKAKENKNIFEKNVLGISSYSASMAKALLEINTIKKYSLDKSEDCFSINILSKNTKIYKDPKSEVLKAIKDFENSYYFYPALFIYGLGNGAFIKALLENTEHKTIIVFEPEIEILYLILTVLDFSKELEKHSLFLIESSSIKDTQFKFLTQLDGVMQSAKIYNLYINTTFYDNFSDDILRINNNFSTIFIQNMRENGNDATDTIIGINQTLEHIPAMLEGIALKSILEQRKNKVNTAIVVSTGPSLNKQLGLLKKIEDKATIICADSSYTILKKYNINPDFVVSIERIALTSEFFNSPVSNFDDNIIFICATLTHENTITYLKDRNYALVFRPIVFEKGFDDSDFGYIGSGQSCAHLAYELAERLGYKRIAFIGQDLAFSQDNKSHSVDNDIIYSAESINDIETAPAYGGKGEVVSRVVWNVFRRQFEALFALREDKSIEILNCTEGGARIASSTELPFSKLVKIIENETKPSFKIPKPLSKEIVDKKLQNYRLHIGEILSFSKKLQSSCESVFIELTKHLEKIEKSIATKSEKQEEYDDLKLALKQIKNIEDELKNDIFDNTFYGILAGMLLNAQMDFTKINVRICKNDFEERTKLLELAVKKREWVFNLAGTLSVTSQNIIKSSKAWI